MSAPVLWIILPLIMAGFLLWPRNQRFIALTACILTFFLTLAAWLLPIDTALSIGNGSFKLTSTLVILGRSLVLNSTDRSMLALIYGSATIWFAISPAVKIANRLVPFGLAIVALLVATFFIAREVKGIESPWRSRHAIVGIGILCLYLVQLFIGLDVLF
jgi:hypothetical protein